MQMTTTTFDDRRTTTSSGALVMVAAADDEMRRLLRGALEQDGHRVSEARRGAQLFDALWRLRLEGRRPDAVVIDEHLCGPSGLDVVATIRQWGWSVPVTLLTALADIHGGDLDARVVSLPEPLDGPSLRAFVRHLVPPTGDPATGLDEEAVDDSMPGRADAPRGARILVAEDDREMARVIARALERDGHEVVRLSDGAALIATLRAGPGETSGFDLLVSDVRMPGATGIDAVRELRRMGSALPVVLITAFCDEDTLTEATSVGVVAVFSKPFDVDDLRTAVHYFRKRTTG